jgi:hypothetical protein
MIHMWTTTKLLLLSVLIPLGIVLVREFATLHAAATSGISNLKAGVISDTLAYWDEKSGGFVTVALILAIVFQIWFLCHLKGAPWWLVGKSK